MLTSAPDAIGASPYGLGSERVRTPSTVNALPGSRPVLSQLAELYRDGRLIEQALNDAAKHSERERPQLEDQLASTRAEIKRLEAKLERYFEAFEDGQLSAALCQERLRGHRDRLEALREQEADLTRRLATGPDTSPDGAALAGLADQLKEILATESPEQAKELLRLLIKEICVHNRRRIVPTYRIPAAVRAIPRKVGGTEHCANHVLVEGRPIAAS